MAIRAGNTAVRMLGGCLSVVNELECITSGRVGGCEIASCLTSINQMRTGGLGTGRVICDD